MKYLLFIMCLLFVGCTNTVVPDSIDINTITPEGFNLGNWASIIIGALVLIVPVSIPVIKWVYNKITSIKIPPFNPTPTPVPVVDASYEGLTAAWLLIRNFQPVKDDPEAVKKLNDILLIIINSKVVENE